MGLRISRWTVLALGVLVVASGVGVGVGVPALTSRPISWGPVVPSAGTESPPVAPGNTSRIVAEAYHPSAGVRLAGSLPVGSTMAVSVGLSPSDPGGWAAYVASEYVPGSTNFRQYLSPSEIDSHYGPSRGAVDAVREYFSGFGLRTSVLPGGFLVDVRGPAASVGHAFGTTFEEYRDATGRLFVSHATAAVLPRGLAVAGVYGLGDVHPFRPSSTSSAGGPNASGIVPLTTCGPGPTGALSPCEIATAYSSSTLISSGANGSGQRIGIVDAYDGGEPQSRLATDLSLFVGQFGLPSGNVRYAYPVPTSRTSLNNSSLNTAWGLEEALDLEWARASAPGASIVMTFSPDAGPGLFYAIDWLVATHAVDVISMSWGEPLTGIFNAYSQPCSFACNASTDGTYSILDPVFEAAAAEGIALFAATGDCGAADGTSSSAVNYPAADPFVTAVGGTVLSAASDGTYLSETGWNGSRPGSTAPGCSNQGGSGGGFSHLPRPAWQTGVPNASWGRAIPDVSLDAATAATVVYQGSFGGALGTSLATPIWAGVAAIAGEKAGRALGFLNPGLYAIDRGPNYSVDFHDIVLGNNGFPAGPGWDPVTGIGTPIVAGLVHDLDGTVPLPSSRPTPFLYASPRYGRAPLNVSFVVEVSGGTGSYPVEGVNFGDGNSTLSGGNASHVYAVPGVYAAQAFAIDSGGNASASPPIAIVVGGGHALSVQLSASNLSPAAGAAVTFTVGATGGSAPYTFDLAFGEGTYEVNRSGPTVVHSFGAVGGYCAEAIVRDDASPVDGAASVRLGIAVGGAPLPNCGNDSTPLALTPDPAPQVRDAPADFPSLFTSSGGAPPPPGLANSLQFGANDSYVRACRCDIFRTPGTYSVEAWENDTVGQGAFARTNVTVMPALVGDFRASTLSGVAPLTVDFSVSVTGGDRADPANTRWGFLENTGPGLFEGSTIVGANVTHTFASPGEYQVVGQLGDAAHGNTSEAFLVDVEGAGSGRALGLTGTISPAVNVSSGATVHFSGAMAGATGPSGVQFLWSMGVTEHALGAEVNETYSPPLPPVSLDGTGAFLVNTLPWSLEVLNANDTTVAEAGFELSSFFAVEGAGFVPRDSALVLNASLSPQFGIAPLSTTATATVSGPGRTTSRWYLGDGTTANGTSANHTYASSGRFGPRIAAGDSFGDSATSSFVVSVNIPLSVSGGPSVPSGFAPLNVSFTALAAGGYGPPYRYSWTFSSGPPANGSVVNRTFASAGTYTATVHVVAARGPPVNRSWTVTVEPGGGFPPALLLAGAGALGVAAGSAAVWIERRERRRGAVASPVSP